SASIVGANSKPDCKFVESAVRRLGQIGYKANMADLAIAQAAFEKKLPKNHRIVLRSTQSGAEALEYLEEYRASLGKLSVVLSFIQDEMKDAVRDWQNIHPEAVRLVTLNSVNNSAANPAPATQGASSA